MYTIVVLICALSIEASDCQKPVATHVLYAPEPADSLSACMVKGMQFVAEANVVTKGYYAKVFCVPPLRGGVPA